MPVTVNGLGELKALAGQDLGTTDWLEITQDRVNLFADATSDHQWIHVEEERAKAGPFGAPIAHGYLTLSLVIPLLRDLLQINDVSMSINYGLDRVRFPSPVKVGSRIRLAGQLDRVDDVQGGVQVYLDLTVQIEGQDKPACVARAIYRRYF